MSMQNSLNPKEQIILFYIPTGHRQAISNARLAKLAGLSERDAREIIYSLIVKRGLPIGSSTEPKGGGYFMIHDEEDMKIATHHLLPRAKSILLRGRVLEKIARDKFSLQLKFLLDE